MMMMDNMFRFIVQLISKRSKQKFLVFASSTKKNTFIEQHTKPTKPKA